MSIPARGFGKLRMQIRLPLLAMKMSSELFDGEVEQEGLINSKLGWYDVLQPVLLPCVMLLISPVKQVRKLPLRVNHFLF